MSATTRPAPAPGAAPAVAGRDLTTGSIARAMLVLSWPATAEQLLLNTTGLAHAYWLGRVGDSALAAMVMGTALRIVLISPMMGLSMGGMAVVARHVGAREQELADRAVMQTLVLVCLIVTPLMVIGQLMAPTFLRWMGASGEVLDDAIAFVRIIFSGLLFMEMLPTMNGVIRGAGHPEYTLRTNIINIVVLLALEPILVLGLGPFAPLGVRGAAWASLIGTTAGVASQVVILIRGTAGVRIHLRDAVPDWGMMRRILRVALPTAAQRFSPNMADALLLRLVSSFGDNTLAAYSLVSRLLGLLRAPGMGVGGAAATMVGQNLGAGKPERAERSARIGSWGAAGSSLLLFGLLSALARPVLGAFDPSPPVLAIAVTLTYYLVVAGAGQAYLTVMSSVLASAGDAVAAMAINMTALWAGQLPLGWLLSHPLGMGPEGIWLGLAVGFLLGGVAIAARFRRGRWRRAGV